MTVNSGKTARKMPKGVPFKKGKGVDPRINRKGAPVRGQSFQEAVARLADMSNEQLADYFGRKTPLGIQFLLQPPVVPMRDVIIARALITLANDFDARGFANLTDRVEGKPVQPITGANGNALKIVVEYADRNDDPTETP